MNVGLSYIDGILGAMRTAAQSLARISHLVSASEKTNAVAWKWQLLSAAEGARADCERDLRGAEQQLASLGAPGRLPQPLDALPDRIQAMRSELERASQAIVESRDRAARVSAGQA
ncbi:MAG: hypothetical protein IPK82_14390 [Polyangiaceae bacterium]|nr:hypothetical protein [Polyangiaceae bacterium]